MGIEVVVVLQQGRARLMVVKMIVTVVVVVVIHPCSTHPHKLSDLRVESGGGPCRTMQPHSSKETPPEQSRPKSLLQGQLYLDLDLALGMEMDDRKIKVKVKMVSLP